MTSSVTSQSYKLLSAVVLMVATAGSMFSQASGTWTATGSLSLARIGHTATLLANGFVLVAGGEDTQGNLIASAELYNPATGKWTVTGSLSVPRIDHAATLLANGEVLVAGGAGTGSYTASAEIYNPVAGKWTTTGSMTVPRAFAGAVLMTNGKVLVAGGGGVVYDPSTSQWTATGPLYYSLTGGSAALLPTGNVLAYGDKFSCYAGQFYAPTSNSWARTSGQCGNDTSYGPLVLLGTGKVLLAGDLITYSGHTSPTVRCALYDPSSNSWTPTGSLLKATRRTAT